MQCILDTSWLAWPFLPSSPGDDLTNKRMILMILSSFREKASWLYAVDNKVDWQKLSSSLQSSLDQFYRAIFQSHQIQTQLSTNKMTYLLQILQRGILVLLKQEDMSGHNVKDESERLECHSRCLESLTDFHICLTVQRFCLSLSLSLSVVSIFTTGFAWCSFSSSDVDINFTDIEQVNHSSRHRQLNAKSACFVSYSLCLPC